MFPPSLLAQVHLRVKKILLRTFGLAVGPDPLRRRLLFRRDRFGQIGFREEFLFARAIRLCVRRGLVRVLSHRCANPGCWN